MNRKVPADEPIVRSRDGFITRIWIKWFQYIKQVFDKVNYVIVENPDLPYTMQNDNEVIFIETSVAGVVNLKSAADDLRCRVINVKASTANVSLTPNGTDLLYGVNSADTIIPDEARDVEASTEYGWY